uniref:Uncharacterized protein n=1 Tax=Rhizophora mucronata TaxID=61149 RepID=A0A2P2P2R1_RHIMU
MEKRKTRRKASIERYMFHRHRFIIPLFLQIHGFNISPILIVIDHAVIFFCNYVGTSVIIQNI